MATLTVRAGAESNKTFSHREWLAGCDKLISIRDEVFAKNAPKVNQLNHSANSANAQSSNGSLHPPRNISTNVPNGVSNPPPAISTAGSQLSSSNGLRPSSSAMPPTDFTSQRAVAPPPAASGIDPIFLTKSTVLVRAEISQKRHRLEKALEEQVPKLQRHKAMDQDALPTFDVTDVLRKAHELVKPVKAVVASRTNGTASSSDSSDEKTFYSSQMDESMTTEEVDDSHQRRHPQLCRFFERGVHCVYGEGCTFSHDPAIKRKLDKDKPKTRDIDQFNADEDASSRQAVAFSKNTRRDEPRPKPPIKEKFMEPLNRQSQADRERQERIARLEAELRSAKAEQEGSSDGPPRQPGRPTNHLAEEPAYSPPGPDEFGRDNGLRAPGPRQPPPISHQSNSFGRRASGHEVGSHNGIPTSPVFHDVRIVTNHISSPVAPQPSRVSPLAVAKVPQVSQIQQNYGETPHQSRTSNAEISSAGPSPQSASQLRNPRKRRRGRDSGEQARNVLPRTDYNSPIVRVKEEPVSPPSLDMTDAEARQAWPRRDFSRPVYVETATPRHGGEYPVQYQPRPTEGSYRSLLNDDRRVQTPILRRVISRNGQHYVASDEPELRRVVTAPRQVRAPMSPAPPPFGTQYSTPQPRSTRAASQIFISPTGQSVPYAHQTSLQPQHPSYIPLDHRSPSPPVRRTIQSPIQRHSINMAPPSRRVIVDQWGNRLVEAPQANERHASLAPRAHPSELDPHYEPVVPRTASVARHSQLVRLDDDGHYVRRALSPLSNGFYEVPVRKVVEPRIVDPYEESHHVSRSNGPPAAYHSEAHSIGRYEEMAEADGRIVRMQSVRPMQDRREVDPESDERIIRMQSVRPVGHRFEVPREQLMRVASVRPEQPRIINLGERSEAGRPISRNVSVFREGGDQDQERYAVGTQPNYTYAYGNYFE